MPTRASPHARTRDMVSGYPANTAHKAVQTLQITDTVLRISSVGQLPDTGSPLTEILDQFCSAAMVTPEIICQVDACIHKFNGSFVKADTAQPGACMPFVRGNNAQTSCHHCYVQVKVTGPL